MEVTGKLIHVSETQQVSEKFSKREIVIETQENYPQSIKLELHQDKTDIIDAYNLDEILTVSFNLRGRSYIDKNGGTQYANTLQAWRVQK